MELGGFSISLAVNDLSRSKEFYETLGFSVFGGDENQGWLIMKSPSCNIGLFQGMFEGNIMTFNPGWDENAEETQEFTDVREIQKLLKSRGLELSSEADEDGTGPASLSLSDPDGNTILIDQHVEKQLNTEGLL